MLCNVAGNWKAAPTVVAAVTVMLHVPVPEQAPDQPPKVSPFPGEADSATLVPLLNVAEHVAPQVMPAGVLLTVPEPLTEIVN